MINFEKEEILIKDGVKKRLEIIYGDSSFGNEYIYSEQFKIEESICSDSSLKFGGCEAKSVKFRITKQSNIAALKGKRISINRYYVENGQEYCVNVGKFYVDSDISTSDKNYRDITAYNNMYYILKSDVTHWYNGLIFPLTIRSLRISLLNFLGVEQEEIDLPNDNTVIHSIDYSSNIMAGTILKDICELNGCFGTIDNSEIFRYVFLKENTDYRVSKKMYSKGDLRYENYKTAKIDGVVLSQNGSNTQIEYIFDTTINPYYIKTRLLNLGTKEEMIKNVAENLYNEIKDIQFVPLTLNCVGNQCIECGDYITVNSDEGDINTYILSRSLIGIQSLQDRYDSLVTEYYTDEYSSDNSTLFINNEIQKIKKDSFSTYTFSNSEEYTLDENTTTLIQYNVYATEKTDVVLMATIPVYMERDGELVIRYTMDSAIVPNTELRKYLHEGNNFVSIINYFNAGENDRFRLEVLGHLEYVESTDRRHEAKILSFENYIKNGFYSEISIDNTIPEGKINRFGIRSVLLARGVGVTNTWDGTITIADVFNKTIHFGEMEFNKNISENVEFTIFTNIGDDLVDMFSPVSFGRFKVNTFNDYLEGNFKTLTFTINTTTENTNYNNRYINIDNGVFELNTNYELKNRFFPGEENGYPL